MLNTPTADALSKLSHTHCADGSKEKGESTADLSAKGTTVKADELGPLPIRKLVDRGDSRMNQGEYDDAIAEYGDALECCLADASIPLDFTNQVQTKLKNARNCLRLTLEAGGDPDHYLLQDEFRDTVRNAQLPSAYLLTIDSESILDYYPLTPEGCQEATREAEVIGFDPKNRQSLRHLASRDDFDFVIYASDGRRLTQVCRTQIMPGPGLFDCLDGLLVIFRQLQAPVPWCWKPGIRWQAEAHLRWDERYHTIGICWVCDPDSAKSPGDPHMGCPGVDYLFVLDDWRRNRIATALVDACRKRWPDLTLSAGTSDAGVAFLQSYAAARPEQQLM